MKIEKQSDALLLVDIQNDFCPGGALAVPGGNEIIPLVNALRLKFDFHFLSQDWHPASHSSFASSHPKKEPGDLIEWSGQKQMLWPDHCIQNTQGAEFCSELKREEDDIIIRKGTDISIDSYSAFFDNAHEKNTGLDEQLKERFIKRIFVVGLAADYCVKFTALDAVDCGYETFVIREATRAVNLKPKDFELAVQETSERGVKWISEKELS